MFGFPAYAAIATRMTKPKRALQRYWRRSTTRLASSGKFLIPIMISVFIILQKWERPEVQRCSGQLFTRPESHPWISRTRQFTSGLVFFIFFFYQQSRDLRCGLYRGPLCHLNLPDVHLGRAWMATIIRTYVSQKTKQNHLLSNRNQRRKEKKTVQFRTFCIYWWRNGILCIISDCLFRFVVRDMNDICWGACRECDH